MFRETQEYGGHSQSESHGLSAPAGETAIPRPNTTWTAPSLPPHTGDEPGPDAKPPTKPTEALHPATPSASADAGGHSQPGAHIRNAACEDISGQYLSEPHQLGAGSGEGHDRLATQAGGADPALIDTIREQWRRRQAWVRAQTSLTLTAKAQCRRLCGGDKTEAEKLYKAATGGKTHHELADVAAGAIMPLIQARDVLEAQRKAVEKELEKMAKRLPAAAFVTETRGVGMGLFAGIVGEAGDLGSYKSVSALWKRMGLAVINGGRQRRVAGIEALDHGYAPERRSLMWNLGDCIVKAQVRKDPDDEEARIGIGELGALYLERKAYEAERVETKAHAHNRAKRYVEKRFLRQLYAAWRGGHLKDETQTPNAAPKIPPDGGAAAKFSLEPIPGAPPR